MDESPAVSLPQGLDTFLGAAGWQDA
ncbi:MAG: hypothetical protein RIQ46_59, partial [Pseudomonadota bacterium]